MIISYCVNLQLKILVHDGGVRYPIHERYSPET
jgi:hypothetical protein